MNIVDAMRQFRARQARDPRRQEPIQLYCCEQLARRGLEGAKIEVTMPGYYRNKSWDVGLIVDGAVQLGISCKSIISNHGGTVPNRVDDMLGEAVSLHRAYPQAVLGYLFMMSRRDESKKTAKQTERLGGLTNARMEQLHKDADRWFETLVQSVAKAAGRAGPEDLPEKFEVVSCSQIDFDRDPYDVVVHQGALSPDAFFDRLVAIHAERFGGRQPAG